MKKYSIIIAILLIQLVSINAQNKITINEISSLTSQDSFSLKESFETVISELDIQKFSLEFNGD